MCALCVEPSTSIKVVKRDLSCLFSRCSSRASLPEQRQQESHTAAKRLSQNTSGYPLASPTASSAHGSWPLLASHVMDSHVELTTFWRLST